ncbi:hypothetical protein B484DRAFT_424144 [Ochromonadaceae sp. CCMP2298]|nr:hypothetical protein B484DRAFT_424144 [Ochromonadaceae sp. CCMP2298]
MCLDYVRICTEERYHCAHASEAERFILERYVFTKKTRHGSCIFTDRMMEWFVRDLRSISGKFWGVGKANRVQATVRSLPELLREGRSMKTEDQRAAVSSGQQSASARQESQRPKVISETFKASMIAVKKHNIWGPGPLSARSALADERVTAYAAAYNMPSSPLYRAVERAENTPPLARVAALQSSINADAIFEWRRRVETDPERLEGRNDFLKGSRRLVTAKECIAELDLPETRALFTALSLLLSEARCRKHDAQGGAEPEPQPQAPEQTIATVPEGLFAKELRTYAQSHESGSQPSTCASASSASVSPRGSSDSEMITNQQG